MNQKEKLIGLLKKLEVIFGQDQRIESFECIGSVKNNCVKRHSDLDLTVYVKSNEFVELFNRSELEKLLSTAGLSTLAIYYPPCMCIGLFKGDVMADIVFKSHDDSKVNIIEPCDRDEILADVYRIFWMDCFYFIQLLDDERCFRWESIRGLNVIRERHILKLLFHDETKEFTSFKNLNNQTEEFFEKLSKTLAVDDSVISIKRAFYNLIILFNDLYTQKKGPMLPEIEPLQIKIQKELMSEEVGE